MEDVDMVTYIVILGQIHSNQVAESKSKLKEQNRKSYTELGATGHQTETYRQCSPKGLG